MHEERFAHRWVFWLLFALLAAAAFGIGVAGVGALLPERWMLLLGGGVFGSSVFAYLGVHFFTSAARARTAPDAPGDENEGWAFQPESDETTSKPNFEHLLSHTLEPAQPATQAPLAVPGTAIVPRLVVSTGGSTQLEPRRVPATPLARPSAVARRGDLIKDLPILKEILGESDGANAGKTRGQCSGCGTFLWAPATRPLRLRCPKCGRTAMLES